jgi:hypothetical protein
VATEGPLVWEHRTVRCTPDSVRCTTSAPEASPARTCYLREFQEALRCNSPDCPVCTGLSGAPRKSGLWNSPASGIHLKPLRYNSPDCPVYTGLSGEPRSNGYFCANGYLQTHSMRASGAQSSGAPILVHRTMNSSCPVYTGHPGGSTSQSSNGQNPTAMSTWQGAPDCPVCTGLSGAPSRRELPATVKLVVEAINTPTTPPFIASKFSTSQLLQEL